MSDEEKIIEKVEGGKWQNYVAVAVLLTAYLTAVINVILVHRTELADTEGRIVIRMTHWQLEAGVREAIDVLAREFEKDYFEETGKEVTIIQNPINERAYKQYVQTQCIGGTAPDLIQIGFYDMAYTRRFFLPTSEYVDMVNPYNEGTDLEGLRWIDTFTDGMSSALDQDTLEYYGASLSAATIRLFYNTRMLKEALGTETPPTNYREFLQMCRDLEKWGKAQKIPGFVPIAGSIYQAGLMRGRYDGPLTFGLGLQTDVDNNGETSGIESLLAYVQGTYSENHDAIRASHEALRNLTKFFPVGFMSQARMDAGFRFTRERSAFLASGSWDVNSYIQDADFVVGVCDFPLPLRDDPDFGRFIAGPLSEATIGSAMRYGVTKFSKHPEVAMRFLMFLSSQKNNERLNQMFRWIPSVKGSQAFGVMREFLPNPEGFWGHTFLQGGGRTKALYDQAFWGYVQHDITYEEFARSIQRNMPRELAVDLQRYFQEIGERRVVMDATLSWNNAVEQFAESWDLPVAEGGAVRKKAVQRTCFVWETRVNNLAENRLLLRFKREVDKGNSLAQRVLSFMTINPFTSEE